MKTQKEEKLKLMSMLALMILLVVTIISGCGPTQVDSGESSEAGRAETGRGAGKEHGVAGEGSNHDGEAGGHPEGSEGEGEESGRVLALDETYDGTRYGAHLVLAYDANSNAFVGRVENTTNGGLSQVRVEVHLSNGTELGPTAPTDLAPGEGMDIVLPATEQGFDGWRAHPEIGSGEGGGSEGGNGGEHGGEHGNGGESGGG